MNELIKENIKQAFLNVFPNSHISVSAGILGSEAFYVSARLFKPDEWANGIAQNDPLTYHFNIDNNVYTETGLNLKVKPTKSYLYCDSAKLRKKTIKDCNGEKLEKRFKEVKEFIKSNLPDVFDNERDLIKSKLDN
jgi:trehalose/maltose hydrolase-like predicted phosphorylase